MALMPGHKTNFQTLQDAFAAGDVALMECQLTATGEEVAVICAANRQEDGGVEFAPFAMLFNGNPYEMLNPPKPDGGFYRQGEGSGTTTALAPARAVVFSSVPRLAVITFKPKGQSMRTLSRKKQRRLFLSQATKLLLDLGAKQDGGEAYGFTLQTKAGRLRLQPDANQQDGPGTVFTCFDDPQAALQFVDCNRFSGKWNWHYFDGWTVETAIKDFSARLRLVLA